MFTRDQVLKKAKSTGFRPEIWEKAYQILQLIHEFQRHPKLEDRFVVKGGTALNLFVLNLPRLSIDLDLNYLGALEVDALEVERATTMKALEDVAGRMGYQVRKRPEGHAGGKWSFRYQSLLGQSGTMEVDMNFLLRRPLFTPIKKKALEAEFGYCPQCLVLDPVELLAGKLAALFDRKTARDLFDTWQMFSNLPFDGATLRIGFVVYGGISRTDWRGISVNDIERSVSLVKRELIPQLPAASRPGVKEIEAFTARMAEDVKRYLKMLLPLAPNEMRFLTQLNEKGVIQPGLLTEDPALIEIIQELPGLKWKAQNVRKHFGLTE